MDRQKVIDELKELGCIFQLQEDGVHFFGVYISDQCLEAFKDIIEVTGKIDNSSK